MTEQELQQSREFQAARNLEDALNTMSWNPDVFARSVRTFHRTLQQELFRTIVVVIKEMAKDDYGVDLRNQAGTLSYHSRRHQGDGKRRLWGGSQKPGFP